MVERPANQVEENLVCKLIPYFFQIYEIYEIKFPKKISYTFTVPGKLLSNPSQFILLKLPLAGHRHPQLFHPVDSVKLLHSKPKSERGERGRTKRAGCFFSFWLMSQPGWWVHYKDKEGSSIGRQSFHPLCEWTQVRGPVLVILDNQKRAGE